jgi:hypothetical protein
MKVSFNLIAILKAIKGVIYQFEGQKYHHIALFQSHKRFYDFHQSREMTNAAFFKKFMTGISVIEQYSGSIGWNSGAIKGEFVVSGVALPGTTTEKQKASTKAKDKFLSAAFLSIVDKGRYSKLFDDFENNFTMGAEHYLNSETKTYTLVVNSKHHNRPAGRLFNNYEGVSFTNVENA